MSIVQANGACTKMNKERILELANMIEKLPHRWEDGYDHGPNNIFNMRNYSECGSPQCIAGWAVHMYHEGGLEEATSEAAYDNCDHAGPVADRAAKALDIPIQDAELLFEPFVDVAYKQLTPAMAAKVLRTYAETGEVTWRDVSKEEGLM